MGFKPCSFFAEAKEQNILRDRRFLCWRSLSQSCGPSDPNVHEYYTAQATAKSPVSPPKKKQTKAQSKSRLPWEENCFIYRSEGESEFVLPSRRELARLCSQAPLVRKSLKCGRYGSQVRMMTNMPVLCFVCLICVCFLPAYVSVQAFVCTSVRCFIFMLIRCHLEPSLL